MRVRLGPPDAPRTARVARQQRVIDSGRQDRLNDKYVEKTEVDRLQPYAGKYPTGAEK
jgi:hypothetical protein